MGRASPIRCTSDPIRRCGTAKRDRGRRGLGHVRYQGGWIEASQPSRPQYLRRDRADDSVPFMTLLPPRCYLLCGIVATAGCHESTAPAKSEVPLLAGGQLGLRSVSAGALHTCGIAGSGMAYCWGWNRDGELGDGSVSDRLTPVAVTSSSGFLDLSAGGGHTCAVSASGASCWGFNLSGQLGDDSTRTRRTPTPVTGGSDFVFIANGGAYTCGIRTDSSAACWGFGTYGQLGTGDRQDRHSATTVLGGLRFLTVSAGSFHTCGLASDSTAFCWGLNDHGQLGDSIADTTRPAAVRGGIKFATLAVGSLHSCGLTSAGAAYCWGNNELGQLGDSLELQTSIPNPVTGAQTFVRLTAGGSHTCGISSDGSAWCWGSDINGQLGSPPTHTCITAGVGGPCSPIPQPVGGGHTFSTISAGSQHTCAITPDHDTYCWGLNSFGQLGNGSRSSSP